MHQFSDASTSGYDQCSYLRLIDESDQVHCSLLLGKSRVTPLKPVTVPRLELSAAVLSVKIASALVQELDLKGLSLSHFCWTDSKFVLGYLSNEARRFHVFVANRIQQIKDAVTVEICYLKGQSCRYSVKRCHSQRNPQRIQMVQRTRIPFRNEICLNGMMNNLK